MSFGGDGLAGRGRARAARRPTACSASCPAGAATTSRASSASRASPVEAVRRCSRDGDRADGRRRRGRRPHVPRHRELRLRLRRARTSRTRRRSSRASSSTSTRRCARSARWKPVRLTFAADGGDERVGRAATRSPRATRACSAAGWRSRPTPTSRTGCSTSSSPREASKLALPARPAEGLQGHAPRRRRTSSCSARASCASTPSARSASTPTATRSARRPRRSARCRARCGCWCPRMRLPSPPPPPAPPARCRAAPAAAARACPARCCCASSRTRSATLAGAPAAAAARSSRATNGKTTTAAMVAAILERGGARLVHNRAGREHGRRRGERAARTAAGDTGLFEVDEFWLDRVVPELRPRAILLANLFRDQLDRYGELETIAERWADGRRATPDADARAQRRRPGGRRPRRASATPSAVTYFGVEDDGVALPGLPHATDAKHCRRCGRAVRLRRGLPRPPRPLPLPDRRQRRGPTPRRRGRGRRRSRASARARFTLRTPRGRRGRSRCRCPASTTSTTRSAPPRSRCALGALARRRRRRACEAVSPAFGRAETVRLGGRDLSILLVKNPAGANEVVRTLALEPGEHDLLGVLNDRTADGARRLVGLGRRLRGPRPARCAASSARARARAELARAPEVRGRARRTGSTVEPDLDRALDAAVARRRRAAVRDPHLHRDARAARGARRAAAWRRAHGRRDLARRRVRRLRRRPAAVARAGRRRPAGPVLDVGAGHRPRGARPRRAAASRSTRSTSTPALLAALRERAARPARHDPRRRRARLRPRPHASRSSSRRCRPSSCSAAPRAARRFLRAVRRHLAPGGLLAGALANASTRSTSEVDVPVPDMREVDGVVYASRPVAVRDDGDGFVLERVRERVAADGERDGRPRTAIRLDRAHRRARSRPRRARVGLHRRGAAARSPRPTTTSAARWRCSVPELRVCALYPDLMNIYADRGNLLLLERRCAWRGIGFDGHRGRASATRSTPTRTTSSTSAAARTATSGCARYDLVETKRDALHAAAGARRSSSSASAAATSCSATPTSWATRRSRASASSTCARSREDGAAPDRQRRDRGRARRRAARPRRLREPRRPHATSAPGEQPLGRVLKGHGNDGRSGLRGRPARRASSAPTSTARCCPKNAWFADWLIAQRHRRRRARAARRRARGRRAPQRPPRRRASTDAVDECTTVKLRVGASAAVGSRHHAAPAVRRSRVVTARACSIAASAARLHARARSSAARTSCSTSAPQPVVDDDRPAHRDVHREALRRPRAVHGLAGRSPTREYETFLRQPGDQPALPRRPGARLRRRTSPTRTAPAFIRARRPRRQAERPPLPATSSSARTPSARAASRSPTCTRSAPNRAALGARPPVRARAPHRARAAPATAPRLAATAPLRLVTETTRPGGRC